MTGQGAEVSRWRCKDCGENFRVEEPGAQMTKTRCAHVTDERVCDRPFWHCTPDHTGPAKVVVWPHPDEPKPRSVDDAARSLRDYWDSVPTGGTAHATKLYDAMLGVVRAVNAAEGKTP